jgi:hypothetical protein
MAVPWKEVTAVNERMEFVFAVGEMGNVFTGEFRGWVLEPDFG